MVRQKAQRSVWMSLHMNNSVEQQLERILRRLEQQLMPMVNYSNKAEYESALRLVRDTLTDMRSLTEHPSSSVLQELL